MVMARVLETICEYFIGVDFGQKQDYTAICILERAQLMFDVRDRVTYECWRETRLTVRHLERMKLRTPYPDIVERIRQVTTDPSLGDRRTLIVDATGPGVPVADLLRAARLDCQFVPVSITAGDRAHTDLRDGTQFVPKRDLISSLQLLFDQQKLQIAKGLPEGEVLMKELMAMRVKVSATGHESYGHSSGAHDDLVLAVALACWRAREPNRWNWFGGKPG